nr:unnamed protein product [Spirometra erinaceieuropaei]
MECGGTPRRRLPLRQPVVPDPSTRWPTGFDSAWEREDDIVLRKKSGLDPSLSKYALCFICWKRDSLVPRPIASLVSSYNKTCPIPVFPFIFSDQQNASEQGRSRDEFLKKVASLLKETRGVPSDTTLIHPAHKFLVTS